MIINEKRKIEIIAGCFDVVAKELEDELDTRIGYSIFELNALKYKLIGVLSNESLTNLDLNNEESILLNNILNEYSYGIIGICDYINEVQEILNKMQDESGRVQNITFSTPAD